MRETELKLSVEEQFATPPLQSIARVVAGITELPSQELRATYYDTADLRLARNGVTLRYRSGEAEGPGWSLKLPVASNVALEREEISLKGSARKPPMQARELVTAFVRDCLLEPAIRLRTRRRRWSLRDADGVELAELVDDRVTVMERNRVVDHFRELEVEARKIESEQLEQIAAVLTQAGASPTITPKALRAMGTRALGPPEVPGPERVGPDEPAAFAVQSAISRSVQRIISNDPGTRLGDVKSLHQMRVGTRRLRSDLRTFSSLLNESWSDTLVADVKRLGRVLGEVRDLDVARARFESSAADLHDDIAGLLGQLAVEHELARERLLAFMRSDDYVAILDRLVEASRDPQLTDRAWASCAETLPPLAARAANRFVRAGRKLEHDSPDSKFHDARVRVKRARYAAEAIAPALGDREQATRRFAKRAERMQELLGDIQDAGNSRELIEQLLTSQAQTATSGYAAGRLAERQQLDAKRARDRFPKQFKRLKRARPSGWS